MLALDDSLCPWDLVPNASIQERPGGLVAGLDGLTRELARRRRVGNPIKCTLWRTRRQAAASTVP